MSGAADNKRKLDKVTGKFVAGKAKETAALVGGLFFGQVINNAGQKLVDKFIPQTDGTAGLTGVTKIVSPVLLTLLGIISPEFFKLGTNGKYSRALGNGIAAYGALKSVKEVIGKDVLAGRLSGGSGMGFFKQLQEPYPHARIPANFAFPDLNKRYEHATDTKWQHQMAL